MTDHFQFSKPPEEGATTRTLVVDMIGNELLLEYLCVWLECLPCESKLRVRAISRNKWKRRMKEYCNVICWCHRCGFDVPSSRFVRAFHLLWMWALRLRPLTSVCFRWRRRERTKDLCSNSCVTSRLVWTILEYFKFEIRTCWSSDTKLTETAPRDTRRIFPYFFPLSVVPPCYFLSSLLLLLR